MKKLSEKINESLNESLSQDSAANIIDLYIDYVFGQKNKNDKKIKDFDKLLAQNKLPVYSKLDFSKLSYKEKSLVINLSWQIWPEDKDSGDKEDQANIKAAKRAFY